MPPKTFRGGPRTPRQRVNRMIRCPEVQVISLEGEKLGVQRTRDALRQAEEAGYDLVEVAPNETPPVCRVMDYGKHKYEQSKKSQAQKQHQKGVHVKEVKFRPYTGDHDLEIKMRNVKSFLDGGHKVKITLRFRGREMVHRQSMGKAVMAKVVEECGDLCNVDHPPSSEGRNIVMMISPKSAKG